MSRSRMPYIAGALLGVGALYFYRAGGNADAAKLKAEADAHRVSAEFKSHLPARGDAQKQLGNYGEKAGAKLDEVASQTRENALKNIEKFDDKVSEGSAKAKNSVSGWFSSGK